MRHQKGAGKNVFFGLPKPSGGQKILRHQNGKNVFLGLPTVNNWVNSWACVGLVSGFYFSIRHRLTGIEVIGFY